MAETIQEQIMEYLQDGASPEDVHASLEDNGYSPAERNKLMQEAYKPKIDEYLAAGASQNDILASMRDAGLVIDISDDQAQEALAVADEVGYQETRDIQDRRTEAVQELEDYENRPTTNAPSEATDYLSQKEQEYAKEVKDAYANISIGGPFVSFKGSQTAQEKFTALRNMEMQFTPMISEFVNKDFYNKQRAALDERIIEDMTKSGFNVSREEDGNGVPQLYYTDDEGNKKVLTRDLWDSILAEKYSIPATIATGIAVASKMKGKGWVGTAAAGAAGAATAFITGGLEYVDNALAAKEQLDAAEMSYRMMDGALGEASMGVLGAGALALTAGAFKVGKNAVGSIFRAISESVSNVDGAMDALISLIGKTYDEIVEMVVDLEAKMGQQYEGTLLDRSLKTIINNTDEGSRAISDEAMRRSATRGASFREAIEQRTRDTLEQLDEITPANVSTRFRTAVVENETANRKAFANVVNRGAEAMDGTGFTYSFDDTVLEPLLKSIDETIEPSPIKNRFKKYVDELKTATERLDVEKAEGRFAEESEKIAKQTDSLKTLKTQADENLKSAKANISSDRVKRDSKLKDFVSGKTAEIKKLDTKIRNLKKALAARKTTKGKDSVRARLNDVEIEKRRLKSSIDAAKNKEGGLKRTENLRLDNLTTEARKATDKLALGLKESQEAVQRIEGELAESMAGAGASYRDFESLLNTRVAINQFISDSGVYSKLGKNDKKYIKSVIESIDKKIDSATKQMPDGEEWLKDYRTINTEYSKMKEAQNKGLYKAIMEGNPAQVIEQFGTVITDPHNFRTVMQQLPAKKKQEAEAAVLELLTKRHTINSAGKAGKGGELKAINFPKLAEELGNFELIDPAAHRYKRWVTQMSNIFKNDPELYQQVKFTLKGSPRDPSVSPTPWGRVAMKFVMEAADLIRLSGAAVGRKIPGKFGGYVSKQGNEIALTRQMGKVLDNPLKEIEVKKFLDMLPPDHSMRNTLTEVQRTYAKYGQRKTYREETVSALAAEGSVILEDTPIGKFPVYRLLSDDSTEMAARTTKGEIVTRKINPNDAATPEKINLLFKRDVPLEELKDPEIQRKIFQKYDAINIGDLIIFPRD